MRKWLFLSVLFLWGCEDNIDIIDPILEDPTAKVVEGVNLPKNPLIWMPFNGNTNDESGNGLDGILYKGGYDICRNENELSSLKLDIDDNPGWGEENDRVEIAYDPLLDVNNLTMSAWINILPKSGEYANRPYTIASRWSHAMYGTKEEKAAYIFSIDKDLKLYFNNTKSNTIIEYDTWYHVVVSVGQEIKLYINGSLDVMEERGDLLLPQTDIDLFLGETSMYNGYWYHLDGKLDDFGLWDRVLTNCEINDLYNL
jgi:hypothetical protein